MCLRLAVVLLPCAVACCGMLLVLLSAVCAVVLSGVLRSDAALWRRRVVSLRCAVQYRRGVVAAERKIRKNFEFREMARLPFPGRCWKSGGLLCCGRLLVAAGCSLQQMCNLLPAPCRGGSSPYGSKNHRITLYCRQADSAAAW